MLLLGGLVVLADILFSTSCWALSRQAASWV